MVQLEGNLIHARSACLGLRVQILFVKMSINDLSVKDCNIPQICGYMVLRGYPFFRSFIVFHVLFNALNFGCSV